MKYREPGQLLHEESVTCVRGEVKKMHESSIHLAPLYHTSAHFQQKKYNRDMKILIIEDEQRIASHLKKGFEHEHFVVDLAFDGEHGLDLATSEEYDVILLDLMLPKLSGYDVCVSIRKQHNTTPILILTAASQSQDVIRLLNAGADDYLTKPFSFEELLARVRALSRRPKQSMGDALMVDDLLLNSSTFQVQRGNIFIKLSHKEFSLLEYMMKHSHTILTKEQLIAHVWNYDADILPNTIEVYMRNLRKKIDNNPKLPTLIQTVRGFGYKIGL